MELNCDSNAHWLYRRCSAARAIMETPLTPLQLSIKVFLFIKSMDEDEDHDVPFQLSKILKDGGKTKKRDVNFVFEISGRAMELRDDDDLTVGALREVAASEDGTASTEIKGGEDVAEVGRGNIATTDDSAGGEISTDAARAQTLEERQVPECINAVDIDDINFDELRCFQLRTRVLGLEVTSFRELWNYLQVAGWTHSSGNYHIPKGRKIGIKFDTEDMVKRVYNHFDLDNTSEQSGWKEFDVEESDTEEGPQSFCNPNNLVEYLDEFCMPDYRSKSVDIQVQRAISARSKAYKRRCKRLRYELLEVAYRERVHESGLVQQDHHIDHASHPDENDASSLNGSLTSLDGSSNVNAGRAKNNGEEVDQYFERKSSWKKPVKSECAPSDFVVPSQQDCIAEVETLHRHSNVDHMFDTYEEQYQEQFREWSFSMATDQSILLYGLGSKVTVLTSFGQYLSAEGDVVSLNGYDPNVDLDQFLGYIDQLFCDGSQSKQTNLQPSAGKSDLAMRDSNKGLANKAASIAKKFASTRSRPLFMLIHNIDGVGLRNRFAQDAIALLTANSQKDGLPLIRVAASIDNVNAAMVLWSPHVEHKFDWAWKKVHTYRPYFEESRNLPQTESSKRVKKSKGNKKPGAATAYRKVLATLAPRHTEVLQGLAALQLSSSSHSIPYSTLKDDCIRKMITSSDLNLRNLIKELSDHKIIGLEKGDDGIERIFVPSTIPLLDILNFKPG